jgi:glycogen synthase
VRVLHLTTEFPPVIYGGLGTAIGGLARASVQAGIDVGVLLFGHDGNAYGRPGADRSDISRAAPPHGIRLEEVSFDDGIDALTRAARRIEPDVLHLHSFWLWPYAAALRDRLGVPLVYTVHSLDRAEYEIGHGPPECVTQWVQQDEVINGADRVIALTRHEQELIREYCPAVTARIRVVGNGIEDLPARREYRGGTAPTVLFSGRFVERKGVREVIDAIRIVHASAPEVRFVLAGGHRGCSGAEMAAWLLPPDTSGAYGNVHFTGWLTPDQMAHYYSDADILLVPSWYEPFGMVVLEGLLHGLVVAAAAIGGPADILEHGTTGCLYPPRDAPALAACILELASHEEDRKRLAAAGGEMVRERWLWPHVMRRMQTVYDEVAAA